MLELFALAVGCASELGWQEWECLCKDSDAAVMFRLEEREPGKINNLKDPDRCKDNPNGFNYVSW